MIDTTTGRTKEAIRTRQLIASNSIMLLLVHIVATRDNDLLSVYGLSTALTLWMLYNVITLVRTASKLDRSG